MGKMRVKGVKQPDSLTQTTEEILEQIIKQSICRLLEDNKNNQRGLTKHTSRHSSLMSFWDRITGLAQMRRGEAETVCLDSPPHDAHVSGLGKYWNGCMTD